MILELRLLLLFQLWDMSNVITVALKADTIKLLYMK